MQGAALLDGLEFDPLTLFEDGLTGPEVDVLRGQIVQALMIPPCVVVMDEPADRGLEFALSLLKAPKIEEVLEFRRHAEF